MFLCSDASSVSPVCCCFPGRTVQECCYRGPNPGRGSLLVGQPFGGNAVRFSHLVHEPSMYNAAEVLPQKQCCMEETLCARFYEKRPGGTAEKYARAKIGKKNFSDYCYKEDFC